jgi:putative polyketide hydroxylase
LGSDGGLEDVNHDWATKYGVGERGAVPVRPDGILDWRCPDAADDPQRAFGQALARILSKPQPARTDAAS